MLIFAGKMDLETITENLRAYSQLEKGTFQTGRQLMDERRTAPVTEDGDLRDQWLYTADGNGYFPVENDVEWAITPEVHNLVLRHLDDEVDSSYDQLVNTNNFRPDNDEALKAKNAEGTLVTRMSKLTLSGTDEECGKEWRYIAIRTKDGYVRKGKRFVKPSEEDQKVMDRLGYTANNLKMLASSKQRITETKIYVPNPDYVQDEVAKDPEHNSLWRASRLSYFYDNSIFNANFRDICNRDRLLGVRRVVAEGGVEKNEVPSTPQEITPALCYETLLADRENAVAEMDDKIASGLSGLVADYLATKAQ